MKKFFSNIAFIFIVLFTLFFRYVPQIQAIWTSPFPPFSVEGNPDEDYFFGIFQLFKYVNPPDLEIYENREVARNYEALEVCSGGDHRDMECDDAGDGCDGGDVELCHRGGGGSARTAHSGNGSCKIPKNGTVGICEYNQRPNVKNSVGGTDFSSNNSLAFPKIQSEQLAYDNVGTDNPITWGSQQNALDQSTKYLYRLMVLSRAAQTKKTVDSTREWPLGWVDWGYITPNGKTLLEIHAEIPQEIMSATEKIVESKDEFYLSGGDLSKMKNTSKESTIIINAISRVGYHIPSPMWIVDLNQTPLFPPSYRQGYIRPSICVWDQCCLTPRCPVPEELLVGNKRGLYYDTSISQTYSAALQNMFNLFPLDTGIKMYQEIIKKNPLVRYLNTSSPRAIPPNIKIDLNIITKDTCIDYVYWRTWLHFGNLMDYLDENEPMGPNLTCPTYHIMSQELKKETAGATAVSGLQYLMGLLWNKKVDQVDDITYHLITIPDAMGQSIQEIQQTVYDSRDTLNELDAVKEYNESLSNTVQDDGTGLWGGKSLGPADAKRRIANYSCDDEMFSAQTSTGIEAYALGTRIGCYDTTQVPTGKCDGQLFGKLIAGSKYENSSAKGTQYFDSFIKGNLTPELMNTYAAAEKETGVPCEILAGIHFVEANNNLNGSLVSGRKIGTPEPDAGGKVFHSLLETATYAGNHLKGKVGGNLKDVKSIITALSRYNGGGNSNCQSGYPYKIPYSGCPRAFEGEDDPYPTNFLDNKHNNMYLLYCADYTACAPQVFERPGSFTVALNVYNALTKGGYEATQLPPNQLNPTPAPIVTSAGNSNSSGFFPKSCGPQSLSTALGCLPYTRDAFVSTLLTFIVGLSGGVALVIMLIATIQIMTAGGNAEQLKKGKELFTSAVVGLLFLIFSVSLLRIIAGDIIKLPGF